MKIKIASPFRLRPYKIVACLLTGVVSTSNAVYACYFNVGGDRQVSRNNALMMIQQMSPIGGISQNADVTHVMGNLWLGETCLRIERNNAPPFAATPLAGEEELEQGLLPNEKTIRWTSGVRARPVAYRFYLGKKQTDLHLIEIRTDQHIRLRNLDYFSRYFWRVDTVDELGQITPSAIYSFILKPNVPKFSLAPNPIKISKDSPWFFFNMPSFGSAELSIYSLPQYERVSHVAHDNLSPGPNGIPYTATDFNGERLPSGLYVAEINLKGETQHVSQKLSFIVIR